MSSAPSQASCWSSGGSSMVMTGMSSVVMTSVSSRMGRSRCGPSVSSRASAIIATSGLIQARVAAMVCIQLARDMKWQAFASPRSLSTRGSSLLAMFEE